MTRLPALLSASDLPSAELCAARMDGEVVGIDECFAPVDQPLGPAERAGALRLLAGARAVAHGPSALWVYGLLAAPPAVHTVWVARQNRGAVKRTRRLLVRETRFLEGDLTTIGENLIVSPTRMVFDLVRTEPFGPAQATTLCATVDAFELNHAECVARIHAVPNLPGTRAALRNLAASKAWPALRADAWGALLSGDR